MAKKHARSPQGAQLRNEFFNCQFSTAQCIVAGKNKLAGRLGYAKRVTP
jgi:hypothetical protein